MQPLKSFTYDLTYVVALLEVPLPTSSDFDNPVEIFEFEMLLSSEDSHTFRNQRLMAFPLALLQVCVDSLWQSILRLASCKIGSVRFRPKLHGLLLQLVSEFLVDAILRDVVVRQQLFHIVTHSELISQFIFTITVVGLVKVIAIENTTSLTS